MQGIAKAAPRNSEETTQALIAIGKEFHELAEKVAPLAKSLKTGTAFRAWKSQTERALMQHVRNRDPDAARTEMRNAVRSANTLIDDARLTNAISTKAAEADANRFPYPWMNG